MIVRTWHGVTPRERSDDYLQFLMRTGVRDYRATPGNRGVYVLRRDAGERAEFLLLTLWDSFDAIRAFAGPDVNRARYYPEDPDYLLEMEPGVEHYEVLHAEFPPPAATGNGAAATRPAAATEFALIGVPSNAGARRAGQDRAPAALRRAGLIGRLEAHGLEVADAGDLPWVVAGPDAANPKRQNVGLVRAVAGQVAGAVGRAAADGRRPIVVGGDCTIELGVCAGLVDSYPRLGLIYFDGDLDLNTPDDTPSGIFDGMVMAHLIGLGAEELSRAGPRHPLMPEEDIVLFGYNPDAGHIDPGEFRRLEGCRMARYPKPVVAGRAAQAAAEALADLAGRVDGFVVHFDVDVIDAADFPAADIPHRQGLGFGETMEALAVFARHPKFAGLTVTEFNADDDPDGACARRLAQGLAGALAGAAGHAATGAANGPDRVVAAAGR